MAVSVIIILLHAILTLTNLTFGAGLHTRSRQAFVEPLQFTIYPTKELILFTTFLSLLRCEYLFLSAAFFPLDEGPCSAIAR